MVEKWSMMETPFDILTMFPVRKSRKQKQAFREAVQVYAGTLGYETRVEPGRFGCRNLVLGDPENAKYLITAHYDTCARMPVPNFITPCNVPVFVLYQVALMVGLFLVALCGGLVVGYFLRGTVMAATQMLYWLLLASLILGPANRHNANDNTSGVVTLLEIAGTLPENQRHKVCFVLFDLEEAGLIGSSAYRKAHTKATNGQLVLNLDCVGDGDNMVMFPTGKLKQDRKKLTRLYRACGFFGRKSLTVWEQGKAVYPSDQMCFPYGVGICALRKNRLGLYLSRIHTGKDTVLDRTNVNILRAALTSFLCCDAVN